MTTTPDRAPRRWTPVRRILIALALLAALGAAFVAGAFAHRERARIRALLGRRTETAVLQTNLYNVRIRQTTIPAEGRDGGLAPVGDDVLVVSRTGRMWLAGSDGGLRDVAIRAPLNLDEFEADPFNQTTVSRELFGVKDLVARERPNGGLELFVSHNHWLAEQDCYVVRVSRLSLATAAGLTSGQTAEWETVFETAPCRPLTRKPSGEGQNPSLGAGGRMVFLDEDHLLVTVGGLGPESDPVGALMAQQPDNSYGKTILIDLASGTSRVYTMGHRNPQGLARGSDGRVWLTEHGARGGDELNLLTDGANYGYPAVSYGTAYEMMTWPSNPQQGRHEGYAKPMLAWTPGIGISQVHVLEGRGFPHWAGDLIVASLNGHTLHRVRIEDGRVIFAEPIPIGHRIRDVTEAGDGSLVLKTDDNLLIWLTALENVDPGELSAVDRGTALAAGCQGCHTLTATGGNAIGPRLWGVVGRDIASVEGFSYSDGLIALDGRWSTESLRHFLAAPDSFAPGTTMPSGTQFSDEQLADLVAYLETLR